MPLFEEAARSADKALAARALLYLGQGQERQGADKARGTYERIIKEFGNQTETVAAARKRLAAMGLRVLPRHSRIVSSVITAITMRISAPTDG